MRTDRTFGKRLRELRHLSKRTLADVARAGCIDFTYLSKIENGHNEAPAEETIFKLLSAVDAPADVYDEMLALAGKIPGDVRALVLAHPEAWQGWREQWRQG